MILAGIDIGTNSVRSLVAEVGPGSFREIASARRTTRLGQNLDRTGSLSHENEERSLDAFAEFQAISRQLGAEHTAAVGTSALRIAANAPEFIERARSRTGISIKIISGEEEARLALLGVMLALHGPDRRHDKTRGALVVDIGGGSTEIISARTGAGTSMASLRLGAVYLTERFIKHDPPLPRELEALASEVDDVLARHAATIAPGPDSMFIGTAGTISTLAAINMALTDYDPERTNRSVLTRDFVDDIVLKLGRMTLDERKTVRGLEHGREDIILAGAVVLQRIMRRFHHVSLLVSEKGLREGIVLDLYDTVIKNKGHDH